MLRATNAPTKSETRCLKLSTKANIKRHVAVVCVHVQPQIFSLLVLNHE